MRRRVPNLSLKALCPSRFPTLAATAAIALATAPASRVASASAAPAVASAPDLAGRVRRPIEEARKAGQKAVVLFFMTTDCPISNRYAPEINRIVRSYKARGVSFAIVQVDAELKASEAASHARAYGFACPVLLDRRRELVRLCGARVTPEAAVVSAAGKILYRGRIDDTWVSLGKPRAQPTRRDLRLALDSVCDGKPVAIPRTTATGCVIEG